MNKKFAYFVCAILFSFIVATPTVYGNDFDFGDGDIDFSGDDIFSFIGIDIDEPEPEPFRIPFVTKGDELVLWKKGEGARSRDPLFLVPRRRMLFERPGLVCSFFFNMSNRLPVYPGLAFDHKALQGLANLTSAIPIPPSGGDTALLGSLVKLLPYIQKMTVQERKVGSLIQLGFRKKNWLLGIDIPLLLVERNYWLCKSDQNAVKALLDGVDFSDTSNVMQTRFGFGDTRIKLGYDFSSHFSKRIQGAVGVEAIIPTSRVGRPKPCLPIKSKPGDTRMELLNDLARVGKDILINPKLGTGHWGVGLFGQVRFSVIPDRLALWARASFDYMFEGNEYRFMPSRKPLSLSVLAQLLQPTIPEGFPIADLFPCLVRACVKPGHIFNAAVGLDWAFRKNWNLGIGYDLYVQGAEKISGIKSCNVDPSILIVNNPVSPRLIQNKVFSELSYTKKGKHRDWSFGIGGDITISSEEAARDWTVFGKFGITF